MIKIYKASKGQLKHREIFDEIKKKVDNKAYFFEE